MTTFAEAIDCFDFERYVDAAQKIRELHEVLTFKEARVGHVLENAKAVHEALGYFISTLENEVEFAEIEGDVKLICKR